MLTALEKLPADRFATRGGVRRGAAGQERTGRPVRDGGGRRLPAGGGRRPRGRSGRDGRYAAGRRAGARRGGGALGLAPARPAPAVHRYSLLLRPSEALQPPASPAASTSPSRPTATGWPTSARREGGDPALAPGARQAPPASRSRGTEGRHEPVLLTRRRSARLHRRRPVGPGRSPSTAVRRSRSPTASTPPAATGARTATSTSRWTPASPASGPPAGRIEPLYHDVRGEARDRRRVSQRAARRQGHHLPPCGTPARRRTSSRSWRWQLPGGHAHALMPAASTPATPRRATCWSSPATASSSRSRSIPKSARCTGPPVADAGRPAPLGAVRVELGGERQRDAGLLVRRVSRGRDGAWSGRPRRRARRRWTRPGTRREHQHGGALAGRQVARRQRWSAARQRTSGSSSSRRGRSPGSPSAIGPHPGRLDRRWAVAAVHQRPGRGRGPAAMTRADGTGAAAGPAPVAVPVRAGGADARRPMAGAPPLVRRGRERRPLRLKTGDTTLVPLLTTGAREMSPRALARRTWLAYVSNESGTAGGLRPAVPRRGVGQVAGVGERRHDADVGAERQRALLPQRRERADAVAIQPGPGFTVTGQKVLFSASLQAPSAATRRSTWRRTAGGS